MMEIVGEIKTFAFGIKSSNAIESLLRSGWLPCDGRALKNDIYDELFDAITNTWGSEIPGQDFCVPDFVGSFLRGAPFLVLSTKDPDMNKRTSPRPNLPLSGSSKFDVGSFQSHEIDSHNHEGSGKAAAGTARNNGHALTAVQGGPKDTGISISATGGNETRPVNHYVMYMIYSNKIDNETIDIILQSYRSRDA